MELKLNDVYRFVYNQEILEKTHDPYWCFDGQLVVKQDKNGNIYLEDTYWSFYDKENNTFKNMGYSKRFSLEELLKQGQLFYKCNLDNVEIISEYDTKYYADEDIFDLSYQHGCKKLFVKRKGAQKSITKMESVLNKEIESIEVEIRYLTWKLEKTKENLEELKNGNINIYI